MGAQFTNVRETAEFLNMSVAWIYKNARRNGITPYRFGTGRNSKIHFNVSEVEAWVKQQKGVR
ncbi:helix-turn-helix domain-containing protein [Streptomyces sp. NBC_00846]|uniref:helix-turn-helix domain-containing protein n=1 Tax=Streptomyces sp. NBC_00846 TaxID=2975849 RepID=UPI00386586C0